MPAPSSRPGLIRTSLYVLCAVIPPLVVIAVTNTRHDGASPDRITATNSAFGNDIVPPPAAPVSARPSGFAPTTALATQPAQTVAAAPSHETPPAVASTNAQLLDQAFSVAVQSAVSRNSFQCTPVVGGAFAKIPFQDVSPDGVLIGFKIGLGKFFDNDVIKSLQPIYLTPAGEKLGKCYGGLVARTSRVTGPPGYAVGAATIRGGGGLDALTVIFMRIKGNHLDTGDCYTSPRLGGPGGSESYFGGDGTPIIGICGRENEENEWMGIGMVFLKPTQAARAH